MKKAIFLDKDGTLIKDIPYNIKSELIELQPDLIRGLRKLQDAGFVFVIVSNQSGIARGFFPENALIEVENRIRELLRSHDLYLEGFYYCPHHPEGRLPDYRKNCSCRKPAPGMFFEAAREIDINLYQSWMIGDILDDVEAGNRAGCRSVLVNNGHETLWELSDTRIPDLMAPTIDRAADMLLIIEQVLPYREKRELKNDLYQTFPSSNAL